MTSPRFLILLATLLADQPARAEPVTPTSVLAAAPAEDWVGIDPATLLVMDLATGGRVVLTLAPQFAPSHIANVRALTRSGWFDGRVIERVQDNYVVQWGDPDGSIPKPSSVARTLPPEYDRAVAGLAIVPLPYRDTFARRVGFVDGFPVAEARGRAWMAHCYGMVGVGRNLAPDTGDGSELYAVIGQAPRALDRNIALVGRVVAGIDHLSALPRGTGDLGFYTDAAQRVPIRRMRLAADMPASDRPAFEWLRPGSASFRAWIRTQANRHDAFFERPAGAVDLCRALPPVRPVADRP